MSNTSDASENNDQETSPALLIMALLGSGEKAARLVTLPEESRVFYDPPAKGDVVPSLPPRLPPSGQSRDVAIGRLNDRVEQKQGQVASIRKRPICKELEDILNYGAHQAGVYVSVFSGGQAEKGSGGDRTGSTRHDDHDGEGGRAADIKLFVIGKDGKARYLDFTTLEGQMKFKEFAKACASAGATGIGAGENYMGPESMHVGFGKVATWGGAGWLQEAFQAGRNDPVKLVSGEENRSASNDPHFGIDPQHAANDPKYAVNRARLRGEHGKADMDAHPKKTGQAVVAQQGPMPTAAKPEITTALV